MAAAPLAIASPDDLVFGRSPRPITCGRGLKLGGGVVYPELNFTLPPLLIEDETWLKVRGHYEEIVASIIRRSKALQIPGLLVEFEQLPAMSQNPQWGAEITKILKDGLNALTDATGIPTALRVTVVDLRDAIHPPELRSGPHWDVMRESFVCAAQAGADVLSIESVGGKEIHDQALLFGDLNAICVALGSLACRDMSWLWDQICGIARKYNIVAGGDSACGFANTAMQLAGQNMLPAVLAAVDRAASAPRSLVAMERGAAGPSKDCAYEGPVIKAITGCPISMEGKSASCAHFSPLGNIAAAAADCWSNESVQNIKLLSGPAPEAFLELLAYDCRLMNLALQDGKERTLRDWMVRSDAALSVEALMLTPEVTIDIAQAIVAEKTGYGRTVAAARVALAAIRKAVNAKQVQLTDRETRWLDQLSAAGDALPDDENDAIADAADDYGSSWTRVSYGM